MHVQTLIFLAVALIVQSASHLHAQNAVTDAATATSLKQALTYLNQGLQAPGKEAKQQALKAILPTKADFEYLFPKEDAGPLWLMVDPYFGEMLESIDEVAAEIAPMPATDITVIDLRASEEESKIYTDVFAMIPASVPAYRAVVTTAKGSSGSSTYLLVKDRWIHIQGLEVIPDILKEMKGLSTE